MFFLFFYFPLVEIINFQNTVCFQITVMPRNKDPIWSFFQEVTISGSARAKCNTCGCDVVKRAASDMIVVLKPISIALDKFQKDNCLLGDCVTIWDVLTKSIYECFISISECRVLHSVPCSVKVFGQRKSLR